ncbi:hypothetical protein [Galactobacter sp.]|nr:hypothetical protein [Galactobacter sp.]
MSKTPKHLGQYDTKRENRDRIWSRVLGRPVLSNSGRRSAA